MLKALKYIRYFFYLAHNWSFAVAFHIIKNEISGENKYKINTTGADELKRLEKKGVDISHATIYMPAAYSLLHEYLPKVSKNHLVDIGCGKGRVLCVAAHTGIMKLTGIDFSKEFCKAAILNLESTRQQIPALQFNIINNDAFYFEIPDDADCLFLFNPFDSSIMSGVVSNLRKSLQRNPRKISIIYFNPLNKFLFQDIGFKEVYHSKKFKYLEGCILENHD